MRFEFATAGRILFGPGTLDEVGRLAARLGQRALVVTGRTAARAQPLIERLHAAGLEVATFSVVGEPTTHIVEDGTAQARTLGCDLVIGFGGGSALDTAKAVAILLTNGGQPLDYLEVIGRGASFSRPAAPCIAIPTTAGTGTEVTRNAVLASPEHRVKVSLRSDWLLPRVALVDPALTASLPPDVTASTGLDALTQLIEPFVSLQANPLTDALCHDGIARAARSLRAAWQRGDDSVAREDMALASLFGGLALANARLGAVHGFAAPLCGMFDAPHGAVCGCLLPYVMAANVRALRARAPQSVALPRYDEIARLLTGSADAVAEDGVAWVRALCRDLAIPGLASYGVAEEHFPELTEKALVSSSMKGNPIALTADELHQILSEAL